MVINITQFAPPSRVSSLVWDKNMEPPAGKVFEGDLVGDVTGDVTGDLTGVVRGSLLGYLSRNGVLSASSGTLVAPISYSQGNNPITVNLNWNGTYAIVGNTQKCFLDDPCNISVGLSSIPSGYVAKDPPYAKSFTSDNVEIDSISDSGDLNIYGAAYIELNGGTCLGTGGVEAPRTMSIANVYIDAGTSLILGDDTPPDGPKVSKLVWDADMVPAAGKKFSGNLVGNVTGNVTGKVSYAWTMTPISGTPTTIRVNNYDEREFYNISPNGTISGTITIKKNSDTSSSVNLFGIDKNWFSTFSQELTTEYATYTIPQNTSSLYIRNNNSTPTLVTFNKFTLT